MTDTPPALVTGTDVHALEDALTGTGPLCWGPVQWMALHQLMRGFPVAPSEDRRRGLAQYVTAMADVIPCPSCSEHWRALARTVRTDNRLEALKWSIDAHNTVNKRLGKPVYTYAQAASMLNAACAGNVFRGMPAGPGASSTSTLAAQADDVQSLPPATHTIMWSPVTIGLLTAACVLAAVVIALAVVVGLGAHIRRPSGRHTGNAPAPGPARSPATWAA
jgi:hypothetical protein